MLTIDCRFCHIVEGHTFHGAIDVPVESNEDYLLLASIGAFVEGWSLVVPRVHCLSLREHYGRELFSKFVISSIYRVQAEYGPSVIFEHGANHCGSATSCGTDHAHLHIVPLDIELVDALGGNEFSSWLQVRASEINTVAGHSEYLFFSNSPMSSDPVGFVRKLSAPSSQYFRKLIAAYLGKTDISDYRSHPHLDVAARTHKRLVGVA